MAAIRQRAEVLVVLSGDKLIVFSEGNEKEILIPSAPKEEKKGKNKTESEKDVSAVAAKTVSKNCVLAAAFSLSGKYFAVGDDDKQLHLYRVSPNWEPVSRRVTPRRCTALTFTHSETDIVIADKTGDVYKYSIEEPEKEGDLLLGHLSMVLDVKLTRNDKYIVTCDRDEKVRISHYPRSYNIHSFFLLHTECVTQVVFVDKFNCLISASGDGTLATCDLDGRSHDCVHEEVKCDRSKYRGQGEDQLKEVTDLGENVFEPLTTKRMVYDESLNVLAVMYYRSNLVNFYTLHDADGVIKLSKNCNISLPEEPWDMCFDSNHTLWVVEPHEQSPVMVYTCTRDANTAILQVTESLSDVAVNSTVSKLKSKWDFFQASVDRQPQFDNLQKLRTCEYLQQYFKRKEERINAKKNITDQQSPPEKKVKTS